MKFKPVYTGLVLSWLPHYHDMGLIGAWLGCLHFAAALYVMSPLSFLVRPESWLWAIHRFRATFSASPNFGFELCLNKIADADLEAASSAAVWGSFTNCGQACLSVERVYVERAIAARFTELCVAKTRALQLGPGSNPENEVGPLIRPEAIARIESQIREAVSQGAQVLCGGHRRPDLGPAYFEPTVVVVANTIVANTVVANIEPPSVRTPGEGLSLMREETFGPVLAIAAVDSADEAVACANDSKFGLSASIWTCDVHRARQLARRIHTGAVMINDVGSYYGIAEAPHGGRGASGWGRTHSRIGLMEMVQVKYVDVDWLSRWPKAWWFGYNQDLAESAGRFIDFLYAPRWPDRWRGAIGALRSLARARRKR